MVILIDELATKRLVERKRSTKDRRHSELLLTAKGKRTLEKLSKIAAEHEADLCAALTNEERETLATLCRKIVAHQGLTPECASRLSEVVTDNGGKTWKVNWIAVDACMKN